MSRKLKIVHAEASNGWGGQEIRILNEARWFRDQGHEIIIAGPADGQLNQRAQTENFRVVDISFKKETQFSDFRRMLKLIKDERPDVIATHSSVDSWVALTAAWMKGVKKRVRYRHVSTRVRKAINNRFQYRKLATHIITTAEMIAEPLREQFSISTEKARSIPTGILPPDPVPEKEESRIVVAKELDLSPDTRFIGQVSVLRSWKGHTYLMDAFEKIADLFPHHHLLLVGEGPQRENLETKRNELSSKERIHLVGHQADPWPWFAAMDVATLCSYDGEGVPQSGLQSMFAGTPFVGTTVGGIPEIIDHEKSGLLFEPKSADAVAEALRALLSNPEKATAYVSKAKQHVQQHHTLDSMGRAVEEFILSNPV